MHMPSLQTTDYLTSDRHMARPQLTVNDIRTTVPSSKVAQRSIESEPVRDWALWLLSGHGLRVIGYTAAGIIVLYCLQAVLWPRGSAPHTLPGEIWSSSLLWISQVVTCILALAGVLAYRFPHKLDHVRPIDKLVNLRIVSRGTNVEALTNIIRRCQHEMTKTPLLPYIIEVVTDVHEDALPGPNAHLQSITVPTSYTTKNNSLYEARALQYAVDHSSLPDTAWIVHHDEETHLTRSAIKGIAAMVGEEEVSGRLRIGQGAI
jgi:egghead protein (zeste-white 4 protein)